MSGALQDFVDRGEVIVHLGVHKTATTFIQSALNDARGALRASGTALILPWDVRPARAAGDRNLVDTLTAQLSAHADDPMARRIVVSEENIIGSTGGNLTNGALYPRLDGKLARLPRGFDHPNVRFLLSLRDYGPYLSSSVTTAVRRGRKFDHDVIRAGFSEVSRGWVDVVAELRASFPAAQLTIWRYEDFATVQPQVFSTLAEGFTPPPRKQSFRTLSDAAMRHVMFHLPEKIPAEQARQIVRQAARDFPISDTNPPFTLWSPDAAAALSATYEAHWQQISAAHPGAVLTGG